MTDINGSLRITRAASWRALAAVAVAATLTACGGDAAPDTAAGGEAARPALVLSAADVAIAEAAGGAAGIPVSGPLQPKVQVTLRAQVPGIVQELRVDRGTRVGRGQLLARIRAEGVQSQAAGAQAAVAAARAQLAVAAQRFEGAKRLHAAGAMSDVDFRAAEAAHQAATAQLAAAEAQAAAAGEAAGYTQVASPIDGIVSDRKVDAGEPVNPGTELFTVVDSRTLELEGGLAVEVASRVRVGQAVRFALDAYPSEAFRGRVARIDPVADAATRQVRVYVELPNAAGRIIGGQYARGTIVEEQAGAAAVTVPASAVLTAADGTHAVLVIEQGKVVRRAVTVGARDDVTGRVPVLTGLQAGARVIAVPGPALVEGTPVALAGDSATTGGGQ